jgi:hypothetical protein
MIGLFGSPAGQALCENKSPTSSESLRDIAKTKTANSRRAFRNERSYSGATVHGAMAGQSSTSSGTSSSFDSKHTAYYSHHHRDSIDAASLGDQMMMAGSINDMSVDRKNVSNFMHRTNLFVKKTNKQFWRLLDDNKSSNKNSVEDISTCSSRSK